MANPFIKSLKYFKAWGNKSIEDHADPKIQIEQAVEHATKQHKELTEQAANIIGNQHKLEIEINKTNEKIASLTSNTRQAVSLADQAAANNDAVKQQEYLQSAESFAAELVTAESNLENLKALHNSAVSASAQARQSVEENNARMQNLSAEKK